MVHEALGASLTPTESSELGTTQLPILISYFLIDFMSSDFMSDLTDFCFVSSAASLFKWSFFLALFFFFLIFFFLIFSFDSSFFSYFDFSSSGIN